MVDEEAAADARAGMDVDAGRAVGELGDDPRDERHAEGVELVREALVGDGGDAGVAEDRLVEAGRGRVALVGGAHVAAEQLPDGGQPPREIVDDLAAARLADLAVTLVVRAREQQAAAHLFVQLVSAASNRCRTNCRRPAAERSPAPKCAGNIDGLQVGDDRLERFA